MKKQIRETNDINIFKRYPGGNRDINEAHVKKLVKKIKREGWLDTNITVNPKLEVLDGQHRLEALRRLQATDPKFSDIEVTYIIDFNPDAKPVDHNVGQKGWDNRDYAHAFAEQGNESYQNLELLYEQFCPPYPKTIVEDSIADPGHGTTLRLKIKDGKFEAPPENFKDAELFLTWGTSVLKAIRENASSSQCFLVLKRLYLDPEIDNAQLTYQINKYKHLLKKASDVNEILSMFDDIYNYKRSANICNIVGRHAQSKRKK